MYQASIENKGDSKYYATVKDKNFEICSCANGANPVDTLLASLCACVGHYVREFLIKEKIDNNGFVIRAEGDRAKNKEALSEISLFLDLKKTTLDQNQYAKMLEYSEHCKIHRILKAGGCRISLSANKNDFDAQEKMSCC